MSKYIRLEATFFGGEPLSRLSELRHRIGLTKSLKDLQDLIGEIRDAIINGDIPDDLLRVIPDIHLEILRQAGKLQIEALTEVSNFVGQINSASYGLIYLKDTMQEAKTANAGK